MKNPEKTTINEQYFSGMPFPTFEKFWKEQGFIGDPKKYYTKWTGEKLPKKKKEDETIEP